MSADNCIYEAKKCIEHATKKTKICVENEDRGYRKCTEEEDRGYNACCDWQPCKLFCSVLTWVSNWVCTASVWIAKIVCIVWEWLVTTVCIVFATVTFTVCVVLKMIVSLISPIVLMVSGPSRIVNSTIGRQVPGTKKVFTDSRSPASAIDYDELSDRLQFCDGGRYLRFRLDDEGSVTWSNSFPIDSFSTFAPNGAVFNSPPNPDGNPISVSYDELRAGSWSVKESTPKLEMLVASSDRVFAKERSKDIFYLALPTQVFLHKTINGELVKLPQSFFKIDPELGTQDENVDDLLLHLKVSEDDESHLATERFPLFRSLFRVFSSPLKYLAPIRNLFQSMVVQVHPFVWVKFDTRPGRGSSDTPESFPSYEHVVYRKDGLFGISKTEAYRSILFDKVLDIGVGLSHLHEQYEPIYGGELDNLDAPSPFSLVSNEVLYRFANGPIQDTGGWVDGTCIYYVLAQLPHSKDPGSDSPPDSPDDQLSSDNKLFQDRYCILWVDEQLAFTERWRVLGLRDTEFTSPVKPMVAILGENSEAFSFNPMTFMDPFQQGYIRAFSRMAVARQIIIVNGFDRSKGEAGKHRLFSIHFSWPTMDRTWRVRDLPMDTNPRLMDDHHDVEEVQRILMEEQHSTVLPQSIGLREDMTLHLLGSHRVGGKLRLGRWVQKYLPPDNMEIPSAQELLNGDLADLSRGYNHPWTFYTEKAFLKMHQAYSHFGVYEKVESRNQYYQVDILKTAMNEATIEEATWLDREKSAKINRLELNYAKLATVVDVAAYTIPITLLLTVAAAIFSESSWGALIMLLELLAIQAGLAIAYSIELRSFPSLYEDIVRFKIKFTSLGPILLYLDKREDKTITLDGIPLSLTLFNEQDVSQTLSVILTKSVRNSRSIADKGVLTPPEILSATITKIFDLAGNLTQVKVDFFSARAVTEFGSDSDFTNWFSLNVDQVRIGLPDSLGGVTLLFSSQREGIIKRVARSNQFTFAWTPVRSDPLYPELNEILSEDGQILKGVSLWFIGITGLANIPGKIAFATTID